MPLLRRAEKRNYRVVALGSSGVGKTAIISKHLYSEFPKKYKETIEDIHRHFVTCEAVSVEIDILDTCGSHEFPAMRKLAITTGDAFLLVYSYDNPDSFENVKQLMEEITTLKQGEDYFVLVIANKADVCEKQSCDQAIKETTVCLEWKEEFFKTSAKSGENIEHVFQTLDEKIRERLMRETYKLPQQRRISLPAMKILANLKQEKGPKLNPKSRSYSTE